MHDDGHTEHFPASGRGVERQSPGRISVPKREESNPDKYRNAADQIHRHIGHDRPKKDEQPQAHSTGNESRELQALPNAPRTDPLFFAKDCEDRIRSGALHVRDLLDRLLTLVVCFRSLRRAEVHAATDRKVNRAMNPIAAKAVARSSVAVPFSERYDTPKPAPVVFFEGILIPYGGARLSASDDQADVEQVLAGNVDAFENIVRRWQSPLINLAYRFCRDRSRAEDGVL